MAALRTRGDELVAAELAALRRRRPDLSHEQSADVARTVHRVAQRLLHQPTVRIRQLAAGPGGDRYAALVRELSTSTRPPGNPTDQVARSRLPARLA